MKADLNIYLQTSLSSSFRTSQGIHQKGTKDLFTAQSFTDKTFLSLTNASAMLLNLSSNSTPSFGLFT